MSRKDEDLWMRKLRESLKDYSESPPPGGWDKLQNELSPSPSVEKRIYSYRVWASAAAILLLAVSAIGLYFLNTPTADEIRHTTVPPLAVIPDAIPDNTEPDALTARLEPVAKVQPGRQLAQQTGYYVVQVEDNTSDTDAEAGGKNELIDTQQKDMPETKGKDNDTNDDKAITRPSARNKFHLPVENKKQKNKNKGWSVGVSVNSSTASSLASSSTDHAPQPVNSHKVDIGANHSNGFINLPKESLLYFSDGVPYYLTGAETEYDHKQPISFGVSVRKGLGNRISLESGITYTQLNSDVKSIGSDNPVIEQKLHYIGIPVRANYDIIDSDRFTLYVAAGGAIEKCVYGELDGAKQTVKPLQLSLNGAVGAQYNITKHVGLYAEPGVGYYFDDGSEVQTIRKENKFNFTLQAGLRLSY